MYITLHPLFSVGVVLAFFSNQQTYESVNNAQTTINSVFENGVDYVHDTIDVRYSKGGH